MTDKKPIEIIRELTDINLQLFQISDNLKSFDLDFGLAYQNIRDATMEIQKSMGNLCMKTEENNKP